MEDRVYLKPAMFVVVALSLVELYFVFMTTAWTICNFLMVLAAIALLALAHRARKRSTVNFMSIASCAVVILAVLWSTTMMNSITDHSSARSGGNYGSTMSTIAPPTPAPVTPYNQGPGVTVWSTVDPQSPTETEQPAPTTTRPPATTTPRTTTAPRPRTTTEDPPPAQQEAPPADQPSDPGSAFGSTGQGGDEPSSGLNDQSNQVKIQPPPS